MVKIRKMLSGAGTYMQGENILDECGKEIARRGCRRLCVIGGKKALAAAKDAMYSSFDKAFLSYDTHVFCGFCTAEEINLYAGFAKDGGCDCVVGVGGGKVIDLSKAAAAALNIPVFTVPTCAATCAAFASLSILYDDEGSQVSARYHANEVSGVFADTEVIARAPARYLAAGMADAMAKSCEYSSLRAGLSYGDTDISKFLGWKMAESCDEVLLNCGEKAYAENCVGKVGEALEDAVYVTIAATGIISGMGGFGGRTGSRFAIAHGFNEVMRGKYVGAGQWLHGEIVAVGILAQLYANGAERRHIQKVKKFFTAVRVPVSLRQMGVTFDDEGFSRFKDEIFRHSGISPDCSALVGDAVNFVRN